MSLRRIALGSLAFASENNDGKSCFLDYFLLFVECINMQL